MDMQLDSLKPLITWLHLHPQWGGLLAFLFSFAESIAIIGLIVPGSLIMTAIGILIGSGVLPLGATILWAIAGAIAGDLISYWFGYHYRENIRAMWPFRLAPTWLDKGERFFHQHGGKGIIAGRFIGPIRPILPVVAGMLNMQPRRFIIIEIISAILWAPAYMLPGIFIGAASLALAPEMATKLIIYLVAILFLVWLLYWFLKKIILWCKDKINHLFKKLWMIIQKKPACKPLYELIHAAHIPEDHSQLVRAVFFLITSISFIILATQVNHNEWLNKIDIGVFHFLRSLYSPAVQQWMTIITFVGEPEGLAVLWLVLLAWFAWNKDWYTGWHWFFLGIFTIGLGGLLKRVIMSPRPDGLFHTPSGWSFPSGHMTLSVAFISFLTLLIVNNLSYQSRKIAFSVLAILLIVIGFTRLYLGAHWLTDIIGATLLAISIVLAISVSFKRKPIPDLKPHFISLIAVISLTVTTSFFIVKDYQQTIKDFTPHWHTRQMNFARWWDQGVQDNGKPLQRKNRFSQPIQTINIQWVGQLSEIQQQLEQNGWFVQPKTQLLTVINYLGSQEKSKLLPLLQPVYNDQSPVLAMGKHVGEDRLLLIIRLWNSHIVLKPLNQTLWVGTLNYRHPPRHHFLKYITGEKRLTTKQYTPVIQEFMNNINNLDWKVLTFQDVKRINNREDLDWNGKVLIAR